MAREPTFRPGIWHALAFFLGLLLVLPGMCSLAILGMSAAEGTLKRDFTGPYAEIFVVIWTLSFLAGIVGLLIARWALRRLRAGKPKT